MRKTIRWYLKSLVLCGLLTSISLMSFSQTLDVKGTVTDMEGATLPGVAVFIKGTTTGTITDLDGNYVLPGVPENATIAFSFIGLLTEEVEIAGKTEISIAMLPDIIGLEEVVLIGYGTQLKKDITGSIGSVSSKDFEGQSITDVDQILQGRTAGVSVTKSSGAPGSSARIRIRGANSILGNNEPLYVIDGFVGGDFESLNPNDIADIKILKDASATAIYGSRGANGVVLISTKNGVAGTGKFSFSAEYTLSENIKEWDLLSASEYAQTANANNLAHDSDPIFTADQIADYEKNGGTDWQKEMFRLAKGQSYQLNYSGGTDKTTYYVSGNLLNQEGIIVNSNYQRFGIRANVTSNINSKLKATIKTNFNRRESNNVDGNGGQRSAINQMTAWAPTTPLTDAQGNYTAIDPVGSYFENPLELAHNDKIVVNNAYSVQGGLTYSIIPGLTYDISGGMDIADRNLRNFTLGAANNTASASRSTEETVFWQITNTVSYKKVLADIHKIDIAAISEQQKNNFTSYGANVDGLQVPSLGYTNLSLVNSIAGKAYQDSPKLSSFIGRVNYELLDRYLLSVSFRSDASSKFSGDNKYANFPSVGLGWKVTEEGFMNDGLFDQLKLRASWGKTGSQAIGSFGTITTFDASTRGAGTSFTNGEITPGIIVYNPGNSDLKWETTDQINAGLDMAFLDSRVSITADVYRKNTYDLLINVPVPKYLGGGDRLDNIGEVLNEGIELNIGANVIKSNDFNWHTSFNAAFMRNEVLDIGNLDEIPVDADAGEGSTKQTEGMIREGYSLSSFYGLNYLGTWKTGEEAQAAVYGNVPGDARYQDMQAPGEAGYGIIDSDDYDIIGSGMPKGVYGWNNTLEYKQFTLNLFFQAVSGIERMNFTYGSMVSQSVGANHVTHADVLDRWDATSNPNSDIPHFSGTTFETLQSSRFVERADYIRLKNLSLSYRLELKSGQELTLMVAASNLLTITKYKGLDPESYSNAYVGPTLNDPRAAAINADSRGTDIGAYPNSKIYSFGLNFNF